MCYEINVTSENMIPLVSSCVSFKVLKILSLLSSENKD